MLLNKILGSNALPSDSRSVIENIIFTEGAILSSVFAGDTILTGHWGVAINLNYGGFANGYGGGNNDRSYVPGWSAFTVNTRTSTSQTTFDKRLLTVMPDGATTINGTLNVAGYITSGNGLWNRSADGVYRTFYGPNEISYYCCGGGLADGHIFMNSSYSHVFKIKIMVILSPQAH